MSDPYAPDFRGAVQQYELDQVAARRQAVHAPEADAKTADEKVEKWKLSASAPLQGHLIGLAFSGGGIRSATFNLGILQALGRTKLLTRIDFLSTVSGGGYIGGWLAGWLRRAVGAGRQGVLSVERRLGPATNRQEAGLRPAPRTRPEGPGGEAEPEPETVRHLRAHSRYLAPQFGLLSLDAWTLIALYLRNLCINLLVVTPVVLVLVLSCRLLVALFAWDGTEPSSGAIPEWASWPLIGSSALGLIVPIVLMRVRIARLYRRPPSRSPRSGADGPFAIVVLVIPAVLGLWLLAPQDDGVRYRLPDLLRGWGNGKDDTAVDFLVGALAFVPFGLVCAGVTYFALPRGTGRERKRARRLAQGAWAHMIAYGLLLVLVSRLLPSSEPTPGSLILFVTAGVPLFLLVLIAAGHLEVAMAGGWMSEIEREFRARASSLLLQTSVGWVLVFGSGAYIPWGLERFAQGQVRAVSWAAALGWLLTNIGGVFAARRSRSEPGVVLRLVVRVVPPIFLIGLLVIGAEVSFRLPGQFVSEPLPCAQCMWEKACWGGLYIWWCVCLLVAVFAYWRIPATQFSLHSLYMNRLVRCYLGASRTNARHHNHGEADLDPNQPRRPNSTGFDPADDFPLAHLRVSDLPLRSADELAAVLDRAYPRDGGPSGGRGHEYPNELPPEFQKYLRSRDALDCARQTFQAAARAAEQSPAPRPARKKRRAKLKAARRGLDDARRDHELAHTGLAALAQEAWGCLRRVSQCERARADARRGLELAGAACDERDRELATDALRRAEERCAEANERLVEKERHLAGFAELRHPPYLGPYPIFNSTLNLVAGEDLAYQDRKGSSFVLTPGYCGSRETGYARLDLAADNAADNLTVGRAITISGAAVDPNMSVYQSAPLTAFLTLVNARLGWWLENPKPAAGGRAGNGWAANWPPDGAQYYFRELRGWTTASDDYVHLSDGGHFENTGAYELIRRRCRYVIVVDAAEDPADASENLANLIRLVRTDFGITINIETTQLRRDAAGLTRWHCAVGGIRYDQVDKGGVIGTLVFVRASLTGDEGPDLRNYAATHPPFPHHSTTDQFFDEAQFESYRMLGFHVGTSVFEGAASTIRNESGGPAAGSHEDYMADNRDLFAALRRQWSPLPDRATDGYIASRRDLMGVAQAFRDRETRELRNTPQSCELEEIPRSLHAETYWLDWDDKNLGKTLRLMVEIDILLRTMELTWLLNDLDQFYAHHLYRGWMNTLRRWTSSGLFHKYWPVLRAGYSRHFVDFCELVLNLQPLPVLTFPVAAGVEWDRLLGEFSTEFANEWEVPVQNIDNGAHREAPATFLCGAVRKAEQTKGGERLAWLLVVGRPDDDPALRDPGSDDRVNRVTGGRLPVGIVAVRKPIGGNKGRELRELLVWVRGAYRGLGVGRESFQRLFARIRQELPNSDFFVRYPQTGPRLAERQGQAQWCWFFHDQGFVTAEAQQEDKNLVRLEWRGNGC